MILKRHKSFIKDFRKVRLSDTQFEKLVMYLNALRADIQLPVESRDHTLQGNFIDCREFHLGGDMLVIYLIEDDEKIILLHMRTHSQLFK